MARFHVVQSNVKLIAPKIPQLLFQHVNLIIISSTILYAPLLIHLQVQHFVQYMYCSMVYSEAIGRCLKTSAVTDVLSPGMMSTILLQDTIILVAMVAKLHMKIETFYHVSSSDNSRMSLISKLCTFTRSLTGLSLFFYFVCPLRIAVFQTPPLQSLLT